jgi:hypothetical protein
MASEVKLPHPDTDRFHGRTAHGARGPLACAQRPSARLLTVGPDGNCHEHFPGFNLLPSLGTESCLRDFTVRNRQRPEVVKVTARPRLHATRPSTEPAPDDRPRWIGSLIAPAGSPAALRIASASPVVSERRSTFQAHAPS